MKISKHICFFYRDDRIKYINQIIDEVKTYEDRTHIFIHTNKPKSFLLEKINYTDSIKIEILEHELAEHPFFLTWKPRKLIAKQIEENFYDAYMYIEDDILVSNENIKYWKKYFNIFNQQKINLGFIRTEVDGNNKEFWTDTDSHTKKIITIENNMINLKHYSYCAFWLYDKKLTKNMLEKINKPKSNCLSREKAAFGANVEPLEKQKIFFEKTCIPLENNKLPQCLVYHLPNNYINSQFCQVPVDEILTLASNNK